MGKKKLEIMSEEEANKKIEKYEKFDRKILPVCISMMLIGFALISCVVFSVSLALIGVAMFFAGGIGIIFMKGKSRYKIEDIVSNQLDDFYEAELERAFGPRLRNKDMHINEAFIRELRPVANEWNRLHEWRFYEGYYHEIHFSIENVWLYREQNDGDGVDRKTQYEGAVLRCKDVCDPALDIAFAGPGPDGKRDIMDPAVFSRFYSARTSNEQSANYLVTPQLRELLHELDLVLENCKVTALILRNGEAILAIQSYSFAYGIPSKNVNLAVVRSRFIDSLTTVCRIIDTLRDNCGKL